MGEQQTLEAMQNGVPAQHIEQQAGLSQQDILNQILTLSQFKVPSKTDSKGAMSQMLPSGLIGGLLNMAKGQSFNAPKMEPLGMTNAIQLQGALQSGQKNALDMQKFPMEMNKLAGDIATQEQTYNQNQPEAKLALKREEQLITDTAGETTAAKSAAETAENLFKIRDRIVLKGPIGNVAGAALSSWPLKIGSAERAEYDSTVNQFVFDVGTLLGQKGRAFTQQEQEMVREKVLKAGLSRSEGEFKSSMKAVFNRINSKAGEKIISLDEKTGKVNLNSSSPLKSGFSGTANGIKFKVK